MARLNVAVQATYQSSPQSGAKSDATMREMAQALQRAEQKAVLDVQRKAALAAQQASGQPADTAAQDAAKNAAEKSRGQGETVGEFGLGEGVEILRFYFTIHVTAKDLEPVTGLERDSFTVRHLWIPAGAMLPFDADVVFMPVDEGLPGVYRMNQNHPASPLGNAFGVTVKKRRPPVQGKGAATRRGGGRTIVPAEFDFGFGMATASRGQ